MINDNKSLAEEPAVGRIETFLQAKEVAAKHRKTVLEIMDTLCHLLQSPSLRKPFCSGDDMITRVELVMACLLIHMHRKTLSLAKLSEAVREMRTAVRPDKKEDKKYHKSLAVFVEKTVPTLTLKGIMDDGQPAVKVVQGPVVVGPITPSPPPPPSVGSTSALPPKRKRVADKVDEGYQQGGRLAKRPMVAEEDTSDVIQASGPPIKTPASKGSVGKKIRDASVASSVRPSAATTTVRRTTLTKGQSASSFGAPTTSSPRVTKPVVSAPPSSAQQVGIPSVRPPSRGRSNASANSSSVANQPPFLLQRPPTAASHRSGPMPTPPLSSGGSASPACHLPQVGIAPAPASRPAGSTSPSATSTAPRRPPVTHNSTVAVKSERSSPAVTGAAPRLNRLASVHRAKEQVAMQAGERTTDPRTRPPGPLASPFAPSASPSSSHTDRETQLQMDVDMLDANLGLSQPGTSNSYSRGRPEDAGMAGTGEVLNNVASISRLDRQRSAIVPPLGRNQPSSTSTLNVDTNVDWYRGLQSAGTTVTTATATASQSQSSFYQTPLSGTAISGLTTTGAASHQQLARSQHTTPATTPNLSASLPPRVKPGIVGGRRRRVILSPSPPPSPSSATHQQSDELRGVHGWSREPHHAWRADERHREPGVESSSMGHRGL